VQVYKFYVQQEYVQKMPQIIVLPAASAAQVNRIVNSPPITCKKDANSKMDTPKTWDADQFRVVF
jgi:hypothetical protein